MTLVNDTSFIEADPVRKLFKNFRCVKLADGVYDIGTWLSYPYKEGWVGAEDTDEYGVADTIEQILEHNPVLLEEGRDFVVTIVPVRREDQSSNGGWRWHKWGEYIGVQEPEHEYLYDDTHIDQVLTYNIYERLPRQQAADTSSI